MIFLRLQSELPAQRTRWLPNPLFLIIRASRVGRARAVIFYRRIAVPTLRLETVRVRAGITVGPASLNGRDVGPVDAIGTQREASNHREKSPNKGAARFVRAK